jgi:hypothetical protein
MRNDTVQVDAIVEKNQITLILKLLIESFPNYIIYHDKAHDTEVLKFHLVLKDI